MIDLTPLDVRNKRGDFKKLMRGYDPGEVDVFLELAAERLEVLVRENLQLRERAQTLQNQVDAQVGREQAVQDALVTAQELRADIQSQSQREADHVLREAEADAKRKVAEAEAEARKLIAEAEAEVRSRLRGIERRLDHAQNSMTDLERRRVRFLREFRGLLERELDVVNVEEERAPFEERAIDLDLGPRASHVSEAPADEPAVVERMETVDDVADGVSEPAPADEPAAAEREPAAEMDVAALDPDADATTAEVAAPVAVSEEVETELEPTPDVSAAAVDITELTAMEPSAPVAPEETSGNGPADVLPAPTDGVIDAVEVAALEPEATELPGEPTSLELELMAGAASAAADSRDQYTDVPDLETLLAEAGVEELKPTTEQDIAPPPAPGIASDNLILFDPNDPDQKR